MILFETLYNFDDETVEILYNTETGETVVKFSTGEQYESKFSPAVVTEKLYERGWIY